MSDRQSKIATLLKLFYSLFKRFSVNKMQTHSVSTRQFSVENNVSSSEKDETDLKTPIVSPLENGLSKIDLFISDDRPEIGQENKWLYPTDGFRIMKHGAVGNEAEKIKKKR